MPGVVLAPGVVHLTYVADHRGRRTWRSPVWRPTETGWLVPPGHADRLNDDREHAPRADTT